MIFLFFFKKKKSPMARDPQLLKVCNHPATVIPHPKGSKMRIYEKGKKY
jgi:hypothetical protein